jgi:hypothetical protein
MVHTPNLFDGHAFTAARLLADRALDFLGML